MDKQCEYNSCECEAFRHFALHHFCNEHNWYLRNKVQRDRPENLEVWLERYL